MRRRLEAGAPADAAARQQRDPLGAGNQPAASAASRVRVLRQQADQAASEVLVQGREQERQDGLGDPGPAGQGGRERLQALEREQLPDERVQYGTVHDDRRKPCFRAGSVYDATMGERSGESMTALQRDALAAELAELEGPKRAEMVEAIKTARSFGDLSENFEYHAAKNEQGPSAGSRSCATGSRTRSSSSVRRRASSASARSSRSRTRAGT